MVTFRDVRDIRDIRDGIICLSWCILAKNIGKPSPTLSWSLIWGLWSKSGHSLGGNKIVARALQHQKNQKDQRRVPGFRWSTLMGWSILKPQLHCHIPHSGRPWPYVHWLRGQRPVSVKVMPVVVCPYAMGIGGIEQSGNPPRDKTTPLSGLPTQVLTKQAPLRFHFPTQGETESMLAGLAQVNRV